MKQRHVQWLYDELPDLVKAGVLPEVSAENIRAHYGPVRRMSTARVALTLCSVLGAMLVGAGIILLLAHNWSELGRPLRALLSFLPMLGGQVLVGWALLRRPHSPAWREGTSAFLALAIGASIALIGQTYHLPGNLTGFLMTWILLGLPLVYLMRSSTVAVLYLTGATVWAIALQSDSGHAAWYWLVIAAVVPFIVHQNRRHPGAPRTALVLWALCLSLCVGVGVTLERMLPGIWIVAYASLFALFYLIARLWYQGVSWQPLTPIGSIGTVILALILTFDASWRRIGYRYYRDVGSPDLEWLILHDTALVLLLLGAVVVLTVWCAGRRDYHILPWVASPMVALIGYAIGNMEGAAGIPPMLFNVYLFVLGVLLLREGVHDGHLAVANGGMGILALLFLVRFFDSEMGILVRGVAFILIGAGFLAANLWLSHKLASQSREVQS